MLETVEIGKYIAHEEETGNPYNFIVASMYTPGYTKAEKLAESCRQRRIPHIICEVPSIHNSLSSQGEKYDFRFSKPNFIHAACQYARQHYPDIRNCFYMDSDVYFTDTPDETLTEFDADWGIYNWAGDPEPCHGYKPVREIGGPWKISHGQVGYNPSTLFCSGTVIVVDINSSLAENLLRSWQYHIRIFSYFVNAETPNVAAEDQILDLVWNNNLLEDKEQIRSVWLPKRYVRFPWWPWVKPIIKHPDWAHDHKRPPTILRIPNYATYERIPRDTPCYRRENTPEETIHPQQFEFWET